MRKQAATYTFRYTGKAPYRARRTAKVLPVATGPVPGGIRHAYENQGMSTPGTPPPAGSS